MLYEALLDVLSTINITEPVLQTMLIAAILGLSIYVTLYTGMFSLANAGFMAIGAYAGVLLTQQAGWGLFPALLMSMLIAGLIAIPVGFPVLRLNDIYLAIATIGFGEVVRVAVLNFDNLVASFVTWLWNLDQPGITTWLLAQAESSPLLEIREMSTRTRITFELVEGARGLKGIPKVTETWMLVVFIVIVSIFLIRLHRSRFGRAMAAIRQDETAAANMGIDVVYVKNVVFFMSALIAGAAGVFEGHLTRIVTPDSFGFSRTVDILAYAVLGGTQTWVGPIVGGMTLKALPEVLREVNELRGLMTGLVLLWVIVYVPGGIVNVEGIRRLWKGRDTRKTSTDTDGGTPDAA